MTVYNQVINSGQMDFQIVEDENYKQYLKQVDNKSQTTKLFEVTIQTIHEVFKLYVLSNSEEMAISMVLCNEIFNKYGSETKKKFEGNAIVIRIPFHILGWGKNEF